ncbi:MAG: 2-amino-4-hydroxy-6-hydroxymethyldihydropteridine diphosphokinase [Myxococcota bacterium]
MTDDDARANESIAYIALGSNLGDRERHLGAALAALRALRGVRGVELSRVYETDPVGPGEQGPYLNAVARVRTDLPPRALLDRLLAIERSEGRVRGPERNASRTLDLDLLLYGEREIDEPGLVVPHPRIAERPFVLEPLCDLAPDLVLPGAAASVSALAAAVRDPAAVRVRET